LRGDEQAMNGPAIQSSRFLRIVCEPVGLDYVGLRKTTEGANFYWVEEAMRRIVLTTAATLAILAAGSITNRADAMTVAMPAGIAKAIDGSSLAQDVAYICRRVWRCGPWGCGWRRHCWWTGPRYYRYRYRY
jgi:hypothetical protein